MSKSHSQPKNTKPNQTGPTQTTTTKLPSTTVSGVPAVIQVDQTPLSSSADGDYSLYVKVGVPVLAVVLVILTASGCIVGATSFAMYRHEQNDKK